MRLIIRDIRKKYNDLDIIDDVSYTFESGRVYGITGGEGAGKTTLLKCICGDCRPDRGIVRIDYGRKMQRPVCAEFAFLRKEGTLPEYMTVSEYENYCALLHNVTETGKAGRCMELMKLGDIKDRLIKDTTDEERLRIRLAAVLISTPPVVMLDGIWDPAGEKGRAFIENIRSGHIVIVTSDKPEVLEPVCDEIISLYGGKLSFGKPVGGINA